ncbi:hypothetical protein IHQ68_00550 [Chelatococcus sambhunathii]|uniref:Uncharacterized protein n=1 Tax=Chelatococcus sambhunathii TaxID=363953 RepID=A0ABU1DAL5_9HYPH|nr:hypothetical protein [Chelatococcus sambhunathii]MDR4305117.1 hypothetical protein [Chelatococcus sambhunathii]
MTRASPPLAAALLAGLLAGPALAEFDPPPAKIPTLPQAGAKADDFAPPGWIVEAKAEGDLDGDKVPDLAFVLHGTDPALKVKNDSLGPDEVDTNPRILGVAVARGGSFRLVAQNATLIPRNDIPTRSDPFEADGLSIARGAVKLSLGLFMSAGGWGMSNVSFLFRVRDGKLETIGYDRSDTQRNTGETETVSVNYITRKMSRAKGSIETEPDKDKVVWTTLKGPAPSIDQIGDGLDFEPK